MLNFGILAVPFLLLVSAVANASSVIAIMFYAQEMALNICQKENAILLSQQVKFNYRNKNYFHRAFN